MSRTHRRVDTIRQKQCTGIGSLKVFNAVQLRYRIHNSSRRKYTIFRQNLETSKLGIKVIHEETRSTITAGTLLTRKTRRTGIRGKGSTAYIHIRAMVEAQLRSPPRFLTRGAVAQARAVGGQLAGH